MSLIKIKHWNGSILHTIGADTIKAAVEALVKTGAYLRGAYLRGADLRGADLRGADLTGAYLTGADLTGAYLRGADLTGAYLTGADLRGAYLTGADLRGADLTGAYLTGAYLRGADLRGADLRGAYLTGAEYGDGISLTKVPIQILGLRWDVMILDTHLKIGCELNSFEEWDIDGDKIADKHDEQTWWTKHKDAIFAVIRATR